MYDSKEDTLNHREEVRKFLEEFASELIKRGNIHDQSKLEEPEKTAFDTYSPKLKETVYGLDEYRGYLREMKASSSLQQPTGLMCWIRLCFVLAVSTVR